jgi:hypothetical protein
MIIAPKSCLLACALLLSRQLLAADEPLLHGATTRAYWVKTMTRIADPVLNALSQGKLKEQMPVPEEKRREFSSLEALGRLTAGIAPWLELGPDDTPEGKLRAHYIDLELKAIANGVDPGSPDYMNFTKGGQPVVDAAFLAHGLLRAPQQLWGRLDNRARANIITALESTRVVTPGNNNWVLFSAMIETALWKFAGHGEDKPIEEAVNKHLEWYKGDGAYGDGAAFHWDYYNSYVIQPMLLDVVASLKERGHPLGVNYPLILERARRFAVVEERLVSPEGSFPILGRSSAYRFGAFQALAQITLMHSLPPVLKPGGVRAAMTAVIQRVIEAPDTFDEYGWLRVGAVGSQPSIAENYISTGSLYLCTVGMLELGLPPADPFWTDPDAAWTQKRIWSGENVAADHFIDD